MNPRFSVVIPVFTLYEKYLGPLVSSIGGQSFADFECLLCVCESMDVSPYLLDHRFREIRCCSLPSGNDICLERNAGIEAAVGEYVLFCDSDDCVDYRLLEVLDRALQTGDFDLVCVKAVRQCDKLGLLDKNRPVLEGKPFVGKEAIDDLFFGRYLDTPICPETNEVILDAIWGRAFKRSTIQSAGVRFVDFPCRAEDALFINDYVIASHAVLLLTNYAGYFWRPHENSAMKRYDGPFFHINEFCDYTTKQIHQAGERYTRNLIAYYARLAIGQVQMLARLYKSETNPAAKRSILHSYYLTIRSKSIARKACISFTQQKRLAPFRFLLRIHFDRLSFFYLRCVIHRP